MEPVFFRIKTRFILFKSNVEGGENDGGNFIPETCPRINIVEDDRRHVVSICIASMRLRTSCETDRQFRVTVLFAFLENGTWDVPLIK